MPNLAPRFFKNAINYAKYCYQCAGHCLRQVRKVHCIRIKTFLTQKGLFLFIQLIG